MKMIVIGTLGGLILASSCFAASSNARAAQAASSLTARQKQAILAEISSRRFEADYISRCKAANQPLLHCVVKYQILQTEAEQGRIILTDDNVISPFMEPNPDVRPADRNDQISGSLDSGPDGYGGRDNDNTPGIGGDYNGI